MDRLLVSASLCDHGSAIGAGQNLPAARSVELSSVQFSPSVIPFCSRHGVTGGQAAQGEAQNNQLLAAAAFRFEAGVLRRKLLANREPASNTAP
jgi:hypothetical protein